VTGQLSCGLGSVKSIDWIFHPLWWEFKHCCT